MNIFAILRAVRTISTPSNILGTLRRHAGFVAARRKCCPLLLGLDRKNASFDQVTAHELRHSVGTRIWGHKAGWDYNLEFVYQFGSFGSGDIQAWTAASDVGFTFANALFEPRLGLKANVTSGDDNPNNRDLQAFNPLFPRGAYFGEPARVSQAAMRRSTDDTLHR